MASFIKKRLHVTEKLCALVALHTTSGLKPVTSWSSCPPVYGPGPIAPGSFWNRSAVPNPRWCGSLLFSSESVASRPRAAVRVSSFSTPILLPREHPRSLRYHEFRLGARNWRVATGGDKKQPETHCTIGKPPFVTPYVPLSLRWASPACAAATAIRPAHVSQSVADGKRKKYWRVAQSKKSTVGSSVCTPTRCTVRKAMDVVFPRGACEPGLTCR